MREKPPNIITGIDIINNLKGLSRAKPDIFLSEYAKPNNVIELKVLLAACIKAATHTESVCFQT